MTINSPPPLVKAYSGNGATVAFGYPFPFFATSDVLVLLFNTATNAYVAPAPVLNGGNTYDYTVAGTTDPLTGEYTSGGTITFNTAPASGLNVILVGNIAPTQNLTLTDWGPFPAPSINAENDRLTLLILQALTELELCIAAPVADFAGPPINLTLPPAALRAGLLLGFDGAGNAVMYSVTPLSSGGAYVTALANGNYTGTGLENAIEVNATSAACTITLAPALYKGRGPVRVRKTDQTSNEVDITDGINGTIDSIISPASTTGKIGGWRDVSANTGGTLLRSEGRG